MVSQRSMEQKVHGTGYTLRQLWADSEPAIGQKSSPYEVRDGDISRAVAAITNLPSSTLPDSPFIRALGTPAAQNAPPQTGILAQRALEEWERTLCENKAVAILAQMQAGRPAPESVEKAPCTDLRSDPTLHPKFLQNYAGGRVRQPRTPNTSAERKSLT